MKKKPIVKKIKKAVFKGRKGKKNLAIKGMV